MNNERSNGNGQPVGAKREYYRGPHRISPAPVSYTHLTLPTTPYV